MPKRYVWATNKPARIAEREAQGYKRSTDATSFQHYKDGEHYINEDLILMEKPDGPQA